jgi:molybdopterin-containing oxidoreductase family iron-sulfur binding subunit
MAYNRCIGTRYCLNNCPYRVRRFNFFEYNVQFNEARNKVRKLLFNPEVTVRSRGVMEKCTFCVQRIQNGKIAAKVAGRQLVDGDIVTACQAACPSEAIVFGDLADPNSRVSLLHADAQRAYGLLDEELYTKPRNNFLARVKNPNKDPALAAFGGGGSTAHGGGHE